MGVVTEMVYAYAGKVLLAIFFLVVGLTVVKKISTLIAEQMDKSKMDQSLKSFLVPLVRILLQVMLIISIASMLGAEMTSFVAVLGAMSFAIGLALQGSLANFAGGVLILILKPFKVGDYIEAAGHAGTVKDIQVFYTVLNTPDNRKIIVPNANLSNSSAVNYSAYTTRRVDFKFGVGYGADIRQVKQILQRIADEHPLVMKDPAPMIVLGEHGDSAVVFYFRVWCQAEDYWTIYFDMMERVKEAFDEDGISIPYPQMDVHLQNHPG
ncbi:mechanosensitive ion channel family protein [Tindallia californiensis]|uniref:Small conductance mechanosensitive channel n=1 Tax=Tindallia californiensis TaxID=159292 RepID=A0A1H3K8T8_9FIRM|nr:mechanosensitive ion channel domain-containing protein [Tindallia californiensis]SDY48513.1 small conductance mechanosensitive channel [Tindallia californiensis]